MFKATLVLIPLFRVYYIFFIVAGSRVSDSSNRLPGFELGLIISETILNSVQVDILACSLRFTHLGNLCPALIRRGSPIFPNTYSLELNISSHVLINPSQFRIER